MLKMYEIKEEIRNCVDEETGEILDQEYLNALILEEKDIEGLALFIKETRAEAEVLKQEIDKLTSKKNGVENRMKYLKDYLNYRLAGEKLKTPLVSVYYMNTEAVEQLNSDIYSYPEEYLKYSNPYLNKTKAKEDLKAGKEIPGLELKKNKSIVVR